MEAVHLIESRHPTWRFSICKCLKSMASVWCGLLKKNRTPLVAFVTAYDQYAVRAST